LSTAGTSPSTAPGPSPLASAPTRTCVERDGEVDGPLLLG
jgi:hypothetical protein